MQALETVGRTEGCHALIRGLVAGLAVHKLDGHTDPEIGGDTGRKERRPSVNERLKDVLDKPREKLEIEDENDQEKDQETENEREVDTEIDRDPGLSH